MIFASEIVFSYPRVILISFLGSSIGRISPTALTKIISNAFKKIILIEKEKELAIIACYKDLEFNLLKYVNEKLKDIDGYTNEIGRFIYSKNSIWRKKF